MKTKTHRDAISPARQNISDPAASVPPTPVRKSAAGFATDSSWRQTRQQRQREETIDRLLACSKFILQRDGHAMFTMRAVAIQAEVRLSGLQHYFESKDHLLVETVRHAVDAEFKRYQNYVLQYANDPLATLTRILDYAFEIVADPIETGLTMELWALSRHSPEIHAIWKNRFHEYFNIIVNTIQGLNPKIDRIEASGIAEICIGNLEGLVVTALTMGSLRSDRQIVRNNILKGWKILYEHQE